MFFSFVRFFFASSLLSSQILDLRSRILACKSCGVFSGGGLVEHFRCLLLGSPHKQTHTHSTICAFTSVCGQNVNIMWQEELHKLLSVVSSCPFLVSCDEATALRISFGLFMATSKRSIADNVHKRTDASLKAAFPLMIADISSLTLRTELFATCYPSVNFRCAANSQSSVSHCKP